MPRIGKRKRQLLEAQRAGLDPPQPVPEAVPEPARDYSEVDALVDELGTLRLAAHVAELAKVDELRARGVSWAAMAPAYNVRSAQAVQQRVSRLRARVGVVLEHGGGARQG